MQWTPVALVLALPKTGSSIAARIAMMAMTTSSSMRVKPVPPPRSAQPLAPRVRFIPLGVLVCPNFIPDSGEIRRIEPKVGFIGIINQYVCAHVNSAPCALVADRQSKIRVARDHIRRDLRVCQEPVGF